MLSVVARPMLPTVQNRKFCITLSFGSIIVLTSEPSVIATADPESASFSGVAPSFPSEATPYTSRVVSSAPKIASQMYWLAAEICRYAIPITTNKDAPVFTPRILGSAPGFRVIDCIRVPEMPSAPPARIPKIVRGTLASTTFAPSVSTCLPLNASSTFVKATVRLPRHSDSTIPATKSNTLDTATAAIFFFFMFCLLTVLLPLPLKADPDTHQ